MENAFEAFDRLLRWPSADVDAANVWTITEYTFDGFHCRREFDLSDRYWTFVCEVHHLSTIERADVYRFLSPTDCSYQCC